MFGSDQLVGWLIAMTFGAVIVVAVMQLINIARKRRGVRESAFSTREDNR